MFSPKLIRLPSSMRGLLVFYLTLSFCTSIQAFSSQSRSSFQQAALGRLSDHGQNVASQETLFDEESNRLGAVASESAICSRIGIDILKAGGNAADSAVATTLCVGVIGVYHSGIGGGGFMIVRSADGSVEDIDFRETAPAAAFEEMYRNHTERSIFSGLASGVPGEIRGLAYLHEKYGVLPWEKVVMPAVHVAREGFPITEDTIRYMKSANMEDTLISDPSWAVDFAPQGKLLGIGETLKRERYANTLETIAREGPEVFYTGAMAEAMIKTMQSTNGTMTLKDLKDYELELRRPATIDYRGYKIYSSSAPGSGAVVLSALKIMEGYDYIGHASAMNLSTHLVAEALRFAYGQRSEMGDPDFVYGMDYYQAEMMNASTAAGIRRKINPLHTLNVSAYDPSGFEVHDSHGTSALVTSDASGLTVALTTTINLLFGSRIVVPETGVVLNNEMNDFSIPGSSNAFGYIPSPANYIRPRKRPLSSICPAVVEAPNGTMYFATSAAGGSHIITAVLQSLWHVLDHNMTSSEALAAPRFHDQLIPNTCVVEWTFDNSTCDFLRSRGHNVTYMRGVSSTQALRRLSNGTFEAASEPRQKSSGGFVV